MNTAQQKDKQNTGQEKFAERDRLSGQILEYTRQKLMTAMPYFNKAVLQMPAVYYEPADPEEIRDKGERVRTSAVDTGGYMEELPPGFGTNGMYIYCSSDEVIRLFREERESLPRLYLHMIFHCLFAHPFRYSSLNRVYWDFAADAAVENAIIECRLKELEMPEDWEIRNALHGILRKTEKLTAERIYHYMLKHPDEAERMLEDAPLFHRDLHQFWMLENVLREEMIIRNGGETLGQKWRRISDGVQTSMEAFDKNQSETSGNLKKVFRETFLKTESYSEFLRKFAVSTEEVHVNDDEFDYIYYTYGMNLYRNMPLIEPLEYRETQKINDFVIALDTSGSCQGRTVRNFLHKTWNILKNTETFAEKMNLHIIQCDSEIQSDVKITNQAEFDQYMSEIEISGAGGTDFRPVFERVDRMVAQGEFTHLRGLLYFTDGYGTFPARRPEFKTAFVFIREGFEIPKVPAWAIRTVLRADELG